MASGILRLETSSDGSRVLAEIAREMGIPVEYVDRVYQRELVRLTARARVRQFIRTLAVRNTRHVLRELKAGRQPNPAAAPVRGLPAIR